MVRCFGLLLLLCVHRAVYTQPLDLQLELASVVFRHGDRSPVTAFPNDEYQESYWPQGFGQLSTTGMQQEYFLGSVLRDRYVGQGLITSNYTRVQVSVRSTDYDRTLMSAESLLAGLFPPQGDQIFNSSILWQPIPVHTVPKDEDRLLRAYTVYCPRYADLRKADMKSAEYKRIAKENQDFLSRMEEETGVVPTTLENVWKIQDTLLVQNLSGIPFPDWLREGDFETLTELSTYTLNLMFTSTEKSRLTAGNWLGKVMGDMMDKRDNTTQDIKLYLYSAHDTTVVAMATALGVYNGIMPPYATALIIELYSDTTGGYWVSLFYRNETDSDNLMPLNVDSCDNPTLCTLDEFASRVAPVIPDDWERECGITSGITSGSCSQTAAIVLGLFFALTVIALTVIVTVLLTIKLCWRRRKCNDDSSKFERMQESL